MILILNPVILSWSFILSLNGNNELDLIIIFFGYFSSSRNYNGDVIGSKHSYINRPAMCAELCANTHIVKVSIANVMLRYAG